MGRIGIDGDAWLKRTRLGDERYLINLIRGLARVDSKNEYVLYVGRQAGKCAQELVKGFKNGCRVRNAGPSPLWLKVPVSLPLMAKMDRCDLLHTQYFSPPFHSCPLVLTVHDVSFMKHPEFFSRLEAPIFRCIIPFSANRATLVVTDSEFSKNEIRRLFSIPPDQIRVVPLAVDPCFCVRDKKTSLSRLKKTYNIPFETFLLFVGTIQPRKNVSILLRAFASMLEASNSFSHGLVLVGEQRYDDYDVREIIEQEGLTGKVILPGFVPSDNLVDFYNAADLFVFPSLYEGFGFPPLEAMACGLPVLASRKGSLPEVLGEAAVYLDDLDPGSIAAAIKDLLTCPEKKEGMMHAGLKRAETFSWEATARRTIAVYEEAFERQKEHSIK